MYLECAILPMNGSRDRRRPIYGVGILQIRSSPTPHTVGRRYRVNDSVVVQVSYRCVEHVRLIVEDGLHLCVLTLC